METRVYLVIEYGTDYELLVSSVWDNREGADKAAIDLRRGGTVVPFLMNEPNGRMERCPKCTSEIPARGFWLHKCQLTKQD